MYLWSVATGKINLFKRKSREAVNYMTKQQGFTAMHITPDGQNTLFLYDSENNAKGARNMARTRGIECGTNICRFKWDGGDMLEFDDPNYKEDK